MEKSKNLPSHLWAGCGFDDLKSKFIGLPAEP
jgi:hypothetical protein